MPIPSKAVVYNQPTADLGSAGYVLVVDDEADIRNLIGRVLRESGYEVLLATDGEDALFQLALGEPVRLVICNLRMPRVNGQSLYYYVLQSCPELAERFVFCSGDLVSEESRAFLEEVGRPCLAKPFELDALNAIVQQFDGQPVVRLDTASTRRLMAALYRDANAFWPARRLYASV